MNRTITATGALVILLAIILGAFGAHGLKEVASPERVASFEVGVRYQFYMGFSMLITGLTADRLMFDLRWFYRLNLYGMFLFSGSIYLLALQEPLGMSLKFLGPITPIGGVLMIAAWVVFLIKLFKKDANPQ